MKSQRYIALCPFLVMIAACTKKEISSPVDTGKDYYPVSAGKVMIYDVDSVVYQEIPRDTLHYKYRIKEKFASTFQSAEGKEAWRLQRYVKHSTPSVPYDSVRWNVSDVWSASVDEFKVLVTEENQPITKLAFPVKKGAEWNGNAGNNLGERTFTYTVVDEPYSIGSLSFDKSLEVLQIDYRTQISYERQSERYARGTGLIFKQYISLYSNNVVAGKPVESRIEKGIVCTYSLIATGYE